MSDRPSLSRRHLLTGLSTAAAAFAMRAPGAAQGTAPVTIRIATVPIDVGAEIYYAVDMGFLAKAGIAADIQSMSNSSAIFAGVAAGALDVGFGNIGSIATAVKKNIPFTIIAPGGMYSDAAPTTELVVAKTSPIRSARDLNGKIIAVNALKNITQFAPQAWLDKNGGDSSTVKFLELPFPQMIPALTSGRVDAAIIAEPTLAEAKADTRVLSNAFSAIAPEFLIGAWVATTPWANAHLDVVKRFAEAIRETAIWANKAQNRPRSAQILARYTKSDPALLARQTRALYAERLTAASMQPQIDVTAKYGGLPASFSAEELIFSPAQ
jgi:NitT/TauT family transport system substrate-binding protein